jgi:hypothetical protein
LASIFDRDALIIGEAGHIYWQVRVDNFDTSRPEVVMTRRIPAPF